MLALSACNDYLDVDAPSKFSPEDIYSSVKDAGMALNGVYTEVMSSNTFGQAYTYTLILNSDVDFVTNSSENDETNTPKRYNQTAAGSTANSVWNATYSAIETANSFIYYLSNSSIYNESNDDFAALQQYMGEAKVMRAMLYYELMCYWGDVPFSMQPTRITNNFFTEIVSRDVIAKTIMEDLIDAAPHMKKASQLAEGIERVSQEACWAMIARIGLQAAGYSLRHADGDETTYGFSAQLPPVGETESPALQTEVMRSYGLHVHECNLNEVLRQSQESGILWNATEVRSLMDDGTCALPKVRFEGFSDIHVVPGDELIEQLATSYSRAGMDETMVITRSNKRANIYNQGIRNMVLGREDELCSGDLLMIVCPECPCSSPNRDVRTSGRCWPS